MHPLGRAFGQPFLVDLLAADPPRVTVQHARSVAQCAHNAVPDRDVVVRDVQLGFATRREVDPIRIGYADRTSSDVEFHKRRSHAGTVRQRMASSYLLLYSRRRVGAMTRSDYGHAKGREDQGRV